MKTIISFTVFFIVSLCICKAQITQDYPFKTYLDSANNLFVCGNIAINNQKDIYVQKYYNGLQLWEISLPNTYGDDRAIDLNVDKNGDVIVCGYIFNQTTNSNDIISLKINGITGDTLWTRKLLSSFDDRAFAVASDDEKNIYITGYVTNSFLKKDLIIKKYDRNGTPLAQYTSSIGSGDDIATDILVDNGFAYVMGYSYQGPQRMNDIVLQVYGKENLNLVETLTDNRPGSDEKPTGFIIADFSSNITMKSRVSLTSVTDGFTVGNNGRKFLTMYIEPNFGNEMNIKWRKEFSNCFQCRTDVATSISKDPAGDLYVSGYVYNYDNSFQSNGLDFATIKYKAESGEFAWTGGVRLFNFSETSATGVDDKASSVKVNQFKEVYVAGPSDGSPNGFSIAKYSQPGGIPYFEYDRSFIPNFINDERTGERNLKKWATVQLAGDGTPFMIVMGWNQSNAYWAGVKYDANGNVLYTINNENGGLNLNQRINSDKELTISNYPNPFNPSTVIRYSLSENRFVNIKIYNALGKEVALLANENKNAGNHSAIFSGNNLPSGVYYYTISLNGVLKETKSMMLLK